MTSIIERRRPRVEPFLLPFDTIFIYFLLQLLLLLFDLFHFVFLALVVDFGLEAVDLEGLARESVLPVDCPLSYPDGWTCHDDDFADAGC